LGAGKKANIGLIASVFSEGTMFESTFKAIGKALPCYPAFYTGIVTGNRAILGISGVGKVNAAHTVTVLIEKFSPSCIINFGTGGTFPSSGLKVGDIAVAEKEVYADEGVLLKDGFHGIDLIGIPLFQKGRKKYFNEFPLDKPLIRKAVRAAQLITHYASPETVKKGTFLTVSACTGTKKRAGELERKFSPLCENMEGASIAHICCLYGIPFVEIRGVSNMVENRDKGKWDIKLAAENCQKAVLELLNIL